MLYGLIAAALFSITAAMGKVAVQEYHVLQILFFRQIVVFASALPSICKTFPQSLQTKHVSLHLWRLSGAFTGLLCGIWAVALLPLTTAVTLGFAQVFFIALLSMLFLNESAGKHRILAMIVGFIGVIIVMRPGVDGLVNWAALIPLTGALGAAVAIVSVRRLSQTESTATLLAYQAIFVGLLATLPLPWLWVTPDFPGLVFLLALGLVATVGQWVGVQALRQGEASVVGYTEYVKLIYAALIGYVIFAEIPDNYTIIGAAVIIASAVYLFHRERLHKQRGVGK